MPVDRVVAGILAALTVPEAIGNRIHLATDNRIRSEDMVRITREELGVNVRLADPTLYRNVTLPVVKAALERLGEPKLANALEKLGTIFGGYGEWGQPIHDVGNDVRILGLPIRAARTPSTPSGCCAATTATCRSTGACATPTRSRGASGSGSRRSTRIELRDRPRGGRHPAARSSGSCWRRDRPRTFKPHQRGSCGAGAGPGQRGQL